MQQTNENQISRQRRRIAARRQRGGILVQAIIILAGLVALMATIAANQFATLQAAQNNLRHRRADIAAKAGIARALAAISAANTNIVTLNDDWAALGKSGANPGDTSFDLGNGATFRVQVIDSNSMIDVNTASTAQLGTLPLTQEQIDSLADWKSATTTSTFSDGGKDDYYNALTTPYNTKLGKLSTLDELLLIRGWTAYDLYYPQTDVTAVSTSTTNPPVTLEDVNGNPLPLIDAITVDNGMPNLTATGGAKTTIPAGRLSAAQAAALVPLGITGAAATALEGGAPHTTFAQLLGLTGITAATARTLLNRVSLTGGTRVEGKLNLNTVTQSVLETVPNVTSTIATAIIAQQATGFTTLGSLTTVPGLTTTRAIAQVADAFGIGSDTWIVRSYGESGGVGVAYEVTIGVRSSLTRVLTWNRLTNTTVPFWWNWDADTTETIDASALQAGTSTNPNATTTPGGSL